MVDHPVRRGTGPQGRRRSSGLTHPCTVVSGVHGRQVAHWYNPPEPTNRLESHERAASEAAEAKQAPAPQAGSRVHDARWAAHLASEDLYRKFRNYQPF